MDKIIIYIDIIIPLLASIIIYFVYLKFNRINCIKKISGQEIARTILDKNNLQNVYVIEASNSLYSNYDANRKVIRLTKNIYNSTSIFSASLVSNLCLIAINDSSNNKIVKITNQLLPVLNIINLLSFLMIIIGLISNDLSLAYLGFGIFFISLIYEVVKVLIQLDNPVKSYDLLKNNKLIKKSEEDNIINVLKYLVIFDIANIVLRIVNSIKELTNK